MRIGIDARLYGVESGTGIGRYSQELLRQFGQVASGSPPPARHASQLAGVAGRPLAPPPSGGGEIEFVVFLRKDGYEAFTPPDERWTKVLADFRPYTIGVQTRYPRIIRAAGVDLMHFTHFDHPIRCPVPFVITIHDLILLEYPTVRASMLGPLRFWVKYAAYRRVLDHAVRQSIRILTPSRSVKEQIAERFGILREKIIATPLGVDHASKFQISNFKFQIPSQPYLLYVGNAYPHKNLEQLVRILPKLIEHHPHLQLVLVGREDDFYRRLRSTVYGLLRGNARTPIVFTGPVRDEELRLLMAGAAAYVSPSRHEGFDLPTVEALAAGTPVIASDIPVHREILGSAFVPFPTDDDAALADAIHRTLTRQDNNPHNRGSSCTAGLIHSDVRATLRDRGIVRAQQFSWRTCAGDTLRAYREALAWLDHEPQHTTSSGAERAATPTASPPHSSSPTSTRG
ncbi:MAG: glycosyltransferase family 1 protein [bacterium]|nr:glycosyltransferase family 1 protein [bacterium]